MKYLKNPKLRRTSKDHQDKSKQKLKNFSDAFDVRNVSEYSVDEIEDYIYDENKEWVDKTRANHYAIIHAFFQFCEKKRWLIKNPVSYVDKPNPAMLSLWLSASLKSRSCSRLPEKLITDPCCRISF